MTDKCRYDDIRDVVFAAIDEINQQLPREMRLGKDIKTPLYGRDGGLDSLGLVTFIVALGQRVEDRFGFAVTLADERIMAKDTNPFSTVEAVVAYISILLGERRGS
jgi:acyl carrier protein